MTEQDRARRFIAAQDWLYATTSGDLPLFYCLKMSCVDPDEFLWFAQYLLQHSEPGGFYCSPRQYFTLDDCTYWLLDPSPESSNLIQRDSSSPRTRSLHVIRQLNRRISINQQVFFANETNP